MASTDNKPTTSYKESKKMTGFYLQMKFKKPEERDQNNNIVSPSRWLYWYYNPKGTPQKFTHFNSAKNYARRKTVENLIPEILKNNPHFEKRGHTLSVVDAATAQTQT